MIEADPTMSIDVLVASERGRSLKSWTLSVTTQFA